MPIDSRISLMVQPMQIDSPMNALAKGLALKDSMQNSQLNQMKMDDMRRAVENQNALRARFSDPNLNLDDPRTQMDILGMGGGDLLKNRADVKRIETETKKAQIAAAKEKLGVLKLTAGAVMANPSYEVAKRELVRFGQLTGDDITDDLAQLDTIAQDPNAIRQWAAGYALEADKLLPKFDIRDLGGTVERVGYDPLTGKPVVERQVARKTMTPGESARLQQAERQFNTTQANQAPTVTEIVDPDNSERMIRVDARRYQGGGVGAPGVIGVSGKEPAAAARSVKAEAGKSQLADVLDTLRVSYGNLNKARAISSTSRSGVSNALNSIASSGVGQTLGRATGTEAQTDRDVIASSRLQLINAIVKATGMSAAQNLNSNKELEIWLKSASDPSQSIETVTRILDNIEKTYGGSRMQGGRGASGSFDTPAKPGKSEKEMTDAELLKALGQ